MPLSNISNTFRRNSARLLRIALTAALFGWLFYKIDLHGLAVQWQEAEWLYILLIGPPVSLACLFINVLRWHVVLSHQGRRPSLMNLATISTKAAFFAASLPGGITTGDIFRVRSLAKKTKDLEASLKSVLIDRVSGLFSLSLIAFAAFLYCYFGTSRDVVMPFLRPIAIIVVVSLVSLILLFALRMASLRWLRYQHPWWIKMQSFLNAIPQYLEDKRLVLKEVILSLALQLLIVVWVYLVAKGLHISVSFAALSIATPLVTLFSFLPIAVGGVGVRTAGYVFFLAPFGLTPAEAMSLSLVSGMVQWGLRLTYGLIFFWDPITGSEVNPLHSQPSPGATGSDGTSPIL